MYRVVVGCQWPRRTSVIRIHSLKPWESISQRRTLTCKTTEKNQLGLRPAKYRLATKGFLLRSLRIGSLEAIFDTPRLLTRQLKPPASARLLRCKPGDIPIDPPPDSLRLATNPHLKRIRPPPFGAQSKASELGVPKAINCMIKIYLNGGVTFWLPFAHPRRTAFRYQDQP